MLRYLHTLVSNAENPCMLTYDVPRARNIGGMKLTSAWWVSWSVGTGATEFEIAFPVDSCARLFY
jgi:hypothetical protein